MESTPNLEGSGQRAMRENEKAVAEIDRKMAALRIEATDGKNVDAEVRRLFELKKRLEGDKGLISMGGM